ncbi:protein EMSY-LIKE 3-like [Typha latifolia]|uniref:protein EMSY-LIKE 3-like n=1 Tax=Typha latifolia TaxID=4733 RepID=UPI003C2B9E14
MEFLKSDSSGTDDDIPTHSILRVSRSVHNSGAVKIASLPVSQGTDIVDRNFQIHFLELEAYIGVLRAFNAQSNVLSWGKLGLMSDLRKELRVSDLEHREILAKISSDESTKALRERPMSTDEQMKLMDSGFDQNGMLSHKRLRSGQVTVTMSPSYSALSPKYPACAQYSPTAVPSSFAAHVRDDQQGGSKLSSQMNIRQVLIPVQQNRQAPNTCKVGRLLVRPSTKKAFLPSGAENLKHESGTIEIRATSKLIDEVERYCGEKPDAAHLEKAKLVLRDHEKALLDAIAKLADLSDGDASPDQRLHCYSMIDPQRDRSGYRNVVYDKLAKTGNYYKEGYDKECAARAGNPCTYLQDK